MIRFIIICDWQECALTLRPGPWIFIRQRYNLNPQEQRRAWVKTLHHTSQIVRATYPDDKVAEMEPFDVDDFEFLAGPDEDEPLEPEEEP